MFYVYVLQSNKTGHYYVGSTNNPQRRLTEHNGNKTKSLNNKGPFTIVYTETYPTLIEVRKRELQIKSYKGGNAFEKLIT